MSRLTTDKPVSEMSMLELAYNSCYIDENGNVRYRDFNIDMDARELVRDLMHEYNFWEIDDNEMLSDEIFDDEIMENLMYGTKELEGLIALFYRNMWAMAELRWKLKRYEDLEEQGLLLKLPCKVGDTVFRYTPRVKGNLPSYTEKTVRKITIEEDGVCIWLDDGLGKRISSLGKTWWLTKEEAEKALEEMGVQHE